MAQDRRAALAEGANPRADLLGVLLGARDEAGQPMTDEELWEVNNSNSTECALEEITGSASLGDVFL